MTGKIIWLLVLVAVLVMGVWAFRPNTTIAPENGEQTVCTMDAMQCPDGSWVGRTGPNCEFVCPN